jgi:hypothetical protein
LHPLALLPPRPSSPFPLVDILFQSQYGEVRANLTSKLHGLLGILIVALICFGTVYALFRPRKHEDEISEGKTWYRIVFEVLHKNGVYPEPTIFVSHFLGLSQAPLLPYRINSFLAGRLAWILASVNIFLGLKKLMVSDIYGIIYSVVLVLIILVVVVLEIRLVKSLKREHGHAVGLVSTQNI